MRRKKHRRHQNRGRYLATRMVYKASTLVQAGERQRSPSRRGSRVRAREGSGSPEGDLSRDLSGSFDRAAGAPPAVRAGVAAGRGEKRRAEGEIEREEQAQTVPAPLWTTWGALIPPRTRARASSSEGAELGGLVALRDADILAQLAWGREDHSVSTGR